MNNRKEVSSKGITLISIVVTIVVLLILAGVTVTTLIGENGIITKANNAKLATELAQYKEDLELYKIEKTSENPNFLESSLTAGKNNLFYNTQKTGETGNIETVLPSLDNKHREIFEVIKGEILINTKDKDLIEVAQSLGIAVNPYDIVDGELLSSNGNLLLMDENGTVTIPDSVTKIGEGAFANLDGLKTIIIPGTVREIKASAFRNNKTLENVVMQEGVEIIGALAFAQCTNLKSVELPNSIEKIGNQGFYKCIALESIEIPLKITNINAYVFADCNKLSKVIFRGEGVIRLSDNAFENCISLNNFIITQKVETISSSAFRGCTALEDITVNNNNFKYESGVLMTSMKDEILFISKEYYLTATEFAIPNGIKNFNVSISNFTNITKITIPSSVEYIRANLLPVTIEEVSIDENNSSYKTYENCIYSKDDRELVFCYSKLKDIILENQAQIIKGNAFIAAINAENITLKESILTIEQQAFSNCKNIEQLKIGKNIKNLSPTFKYGNYSGNVIIDSQNINYIVENNIIYSKNKEILIAVTGRINGKFILDSDVKEIGTKAFHGHSEMLDIELTNNLEKIGDSFQWCNGLTYIKIPSNVKEIDKQAFADSINIKEIRVHNKKDLISGAPWGAITGAKAVVWDE